MKTRSISLASMRAALAAGFLLLTVACAATPDGTAIPPAPAAEVFTAAPPLSAAGSNPSRTPLLLPVPRYRRRLGRVPKYWPSPTRPCGVRRSLDRRSPPRG